MPKKEKAAAKKKDDDGAPKAVDEKVVLERKQESLKHQLAIQSNLSADAEQQTRESRQRLLDMHKAFEEEKRQNFEVVADMTRQHKTMREELLIKINTLEEKCTQLQDKVEQAAREAAENERRNNQALQLKDAEIIEHRQKMDDMAVEFSQMLKLTLEKMSEKVAVTSDLLSNRRLDDL